VLSLIGLWASGVFGAKTKENQAVAAITEPGLARPGPLAPAPAPLSPQTKVAELARVQVELGKMNFILDRSDGRRAIGSASKLSTR